MAVDIARDLTETMLSLKGWGISAPQVGWRYRAFAVATNPVIVCFNPNIVDRSEENAELVEGCLSFPGIFLKVSRPRKIRIRFTMPNGETDTFVYDGMTARIILHEYDHLEGITFDQHVSNLKWDIAKRKAKKRVG